MEETYQALPRFVMKEPKWVTCPACQEDWTKLRSCQFLNEGRMEWSHVCVVCAETLVSFNHVVACGPLEGVEVMVKWKGAKSMRVQIGDRIDSFDIPRNAYVTISYGDILYVLTSDGTGRPLKYTSNTSKGEKLADNVFSLWSKIKHELLNPMPLLEQPSRFDQVEKMIRGSKKLIPMAFAITQMWNR